MSKLPAAALLAALALTTACSPSALVGLAGPMIQQTAMASLKAQVTSSGGTAAQAQCAADNFNANVRSEDWAAAAAAGGDSPKIQNAMKAAISACMPGK